MGQNIGSYLGNLKEKEGASFQLKEFDEAPASATAPGEEGEVRITKTAIYVCTDQDTWVKVDIATWV